MAARTIIEGHAILSADDRIADADGIKPMSLQNDADWANFQAALDAAAAVIIGRVSHATDPDRKKRNRVIVSSGANGLERREDGWWWNPDQVGYETMIARVAPQGGRVAVPGGRGVFDLFLKIGFDEFHLARAHRAMLPDGVPVFSAVAEGFLAEECLRRSGLHPGETSDLDARAGVTLTVWRR